MSKTTFIETIQKGYAFEGAAIELGAGMFNGEVCADAKIKIPLRMRTATDFSLVQRGLEKQKHSKF